MGIDLTDRCYRDERVEWCPLKKQAKQHNQWTQPEDHKLAKKRLREGTFALQAHDPESVVRVRSLKVRALP